MEIRDFSEQKGSPTFVLTLLTSKLRHRHNYKPGFLAFAAALYDSSNLIMDVPDQRQSEVLQAPMAARLGGESEAASAPGLFLVASMPCPRR